MAFLVSLIKLRRLTALLIVIVATLIYPSWSQTQADDWNWINDHFKPALADLMPIKQDSGMYIGYRSHRDLYTDVLEYSFVMEYDPKETSTGITLTSVRIRQADTVSIWDQMLKMHRSNPREDAASIQKKVKLKSWNLTQEACPALGTQFAKFQQLSVQMPSFDTIYLHPLVNEFYIVASGGNLDLELYGSESPLVQWAKETRQALENCVNAPHQQAR
jgi:hypothetical protein